MLNDVLLKFRDDFGNASVRPLKDDAFANYARTDAASVVETTIDRPDLSVTVSVGQGNWAEVPWIGIFNPEITTTATNGIYVVYLFSTDLKTVYLCQGQGVTSVKNEFGREQKPELLRRSDLIRSRVPDYKTFFSSGLIELGGSSQLAKSYEPAVAYFKAYDLYNLPGNKQLENDLTKILNLYDLLISRGGTDNIETFSRFATEDEEVTIKEQRQYVRHSRIERNSSAAKKVKQQLGVICMGCGFNFKRIYGERGQDYIEAHHLIPLHELPEGKSVSMDPKKDFAVLCANCHRMVHRKKPMLTLEELQNIKGVKMLREAFLKKRVK